MDFDPRLLTISLDSGLHLYDWNFGAKTPKPGFDNNSLIAAAISGFQTFCSEYAGVGNLKQISLVKNGVESRMTIQYGGDINLALKYDYDPSKSDGTPEWLAKVDREFRADFVDKSTDINPESDLDFVDNANKTTHFLPFNNKLAKLETELYDMVRNAPEITPSKYHLREDGIFYLLKCEEAERMGKATGKTPAGAPSEMATLYFPPNAPPELTNTFHMLSNFAEGLLNPSEGNSYECFLDFEKENGIHTTAFVASRSRLMDSTISGQNVTRKYSNLLMAYTNQSDEGLTKKEIIAECVGFIDSDNPTFVDKNNPEILVPADDMKYKMEKLRMGWYERGLLPIQRARSR